MKGAHAVVAAVVDAVRRHAALLRSMLGNRERDIARESDGLNCDTEARRGEVRREKAKNRIEEIST